MAEEETQAEIMNKKAEYYPSTLDLVRGKAPKENFWKYFIKVDPKDQWNWVCLAAAVLLFWWSFKTIFAAFS